MHLQREARMASTTRRSHGVVSVNRWAATMLLAGAMQLHLQHTNMLSPSSTLC